ncbi:hypothetical protein [Streptomyces himalayensis]|uniref:Uncharacterized protein n=1 Tax=Streptomyces himalayensis subsp. himalayensis TaxID=2756131 RepID=A0A7W0IB29_9ACTN|nr:hypothetical protein [Streptomyces himalayensis]MBA2948963.1 hypothetical protein [Streptomyces himalayensis subsp. himalayensis]
MILEVTPPFGVGPVRVGMTLDEAEAALRSVEGYREPEPTGVPTRGTADYDSGMSIGVETSGGLVEAVQVYRPYGDVEVSYQGIDLLRTPARQVIERLGALTELEEDEGGRSYTAPELLLALWRPFVEDENPAEEQGHYFQSVLVARPGYYD